MKSRKKLLSVLSILAILIGWAIFQNSLQASPGKKYTVQRGDSIYKISKKFGVDIRAILGANPGLNPATLRVDQVIIIMEPPLFVRIGRKMDATSKKAGIDDPPFERFAWKFSN